MSGIIQLLIRLLPLLSSLWPIIQGFLNHQTALSSGSVGWNSTYLLYGPGIGVGGGVGGYVVGSAVSEYLLTLMKNGVIGYRLRMAAKLDSGSSEKEIDAACDRLKRD